MKYLNYIFLLTGFILFGCANATDPSYNSLVESLNGLDARQAIALANQWRDSTPKVKSHITPQEVIFDFPDGRTVKKTIPDSVMYIAVAPYITTTHTCSQHYPSSCKGEMSETTVRLKASDDSGNIYYDGDIKTLKYGFFEVWFPRNKAIKLEISYNSLTGQGIVATLSDSKTCITTINLK